MYEEQLLIFMPYREAHLEFDYNSLMFRFVNYAQEQFIPSCRCNLTSSVPFDILSGAFKAFGHI